VVGNAEVNRGAPRFRGWLAGLERVLLHVLNYTHANPVIRKLVKHPKDWAWSSWSHYRGREAGLIRIDARQ
jgi:hypothetical protein